MRTQTLLSGISLSTILVSYSRPALKGPRCLQEKREPGCQGVCRKVLAGSLGKVGIRYLADLLPLPLLLTPLLPGRHLDLTFRQTHVHTSKQEDLRAQSLPLLAWEIQVMFQVAYLMCNGKRTLHLSLSRVVNPQLYSDCLTANSALKHTVVSQYISLQWSTNPVKKQNRTYAWSY